MTKKGKYISKKVDANRIIKIAARALGLHQQHGESIEQFGRRVAKTRGIDVPLGVKKIAIASALRVSFYNSYRSQNGAIRISSSQTITVNDPVLKEFYKSSEWLRLGFDVKKERGRRCECCGATPETGVRIITDHVKPIRKHWHLRLERSNLQILCDDCNLGKGSRDETDFRQRAEETPDGIPQMLIDQLTPPDGFL